MYVYMYACMLYEDIKSHYLFFFSDIRECPNQLTYTPEISRGNLPE